MESKASRFDRDPIVSSIGRASRDRKESEEYSSGRAFSVHRLSPCIVRALDLPSSSHAIIRETRKKKRRRGRNVAELESMIIARPLSDRLHAPRR